MEHYLPVNTILKKASDRISFDRVKYQEKNVPTHIENVCCMVFFGDIRSQFLASSMLMKRVKEELFGSKYFILCSWPGQKDSGRHRCPPKAGPSGLPKWPAHGWR